MKSKEELIKELRIKIDKLEEIRKKVIFHEEPYNKEECCINTFDAFWDMHDYIKGMQTLIYDIEDYDDPYRQEQMKRREKEKW